MNFYTLNNMHSVSSNAVAKCLAYSLIEQKTGETWVDGKPIYRLVVQGAIGTTGTWVEIGDMSIYNIDKMVEEYGIIATNSGYWVDIGNYGSGLHYNLPSAGKISMYSSWAGNYSLYFKYTKTTD